MDKKLKAAFIFLILFALVGIVLTYVYSGGIAILSPKGMIAHRQSELFAITTIVMLFIVIPTLLLAFFITWKYREGKSDHEHAPDWDHSTKAELVWWGFPFLITIILGVMTWKSCHELDPFKPLDSKVKPIKIQVVALQWKWLFIYPEERIASLNFLQFPENTPLNFEITSDAPMNSFWIPELGGQVYAMSGMKSKLHLIANQQGTFRGVSSNISGEGFAGMTFMAKASTQEEFDNWVESARGAKELTFTAYDELVKPSSYVAPQSYSLQEGGLFDWIVMKYMMPMKEGERMDHNGH